MFINRYILKSEEVPQGWYVTDWAGSQTHKEIRRDLTQIEIIEWQNAKAAAEQKSFEAKNKSRRSAYLDAYRKYQAAVLFGEFERACVLEDFIEALRNKDWTAFNNVPSQIKYFTGEISFAQSGLVLKYNHGGGGQI